jgi:hypothetical protein
VSGQVTYDGSPVPGGVVTFRPVDSQQNSVSAPLDEQGNYEAVLPVGEVKVSIDNRQLDPRTSPVGNFRPDLPLSPEIKEKLGRGKPAPAKPSESSEKKPSGKYVKIPPRYHDSEKSGIHFTVASGAQKFDIKLEK